MKKTYINPNMKVVKMQIHQHLLDVSGFNNQLNTTGGSGSSALGREFDFEDEE